MPCGTGSVGLNKVPAAVVNSLLFGLGHATCPFYFVLATLNGLFFSAVFIETGDLVVPIVAHALYDLAVLGVVYRKLRTEQRDDAGRR